MVPLQFCEVNVLSRLLLLFLLLFQKHQLMCDGHWSAGYLGRGEYGLILGLPAYVGIHNHFSRFHLTRGQSSHGVRSSLLSYWFLYDPLTPHFPSKCVLVPGFMLQIQKRK